MGSEAPFLRPSVKGKSTQLANFISGLRQADREKWQLLFQDIEDMVDKMFRLEMKCGVTEPPQKDV